MTVGNTTVLQHTISGRHEASVLCIADALDGRHIRLTNVAGGVAFDVNGDGVLDRVGWTVPGADVRLLALDRNGNGVIDSLGELFGQAVSGRRHPEGAANSFSDLGAFDRPENGGNGDGLISAADAVFSQLRLWVDANHDGASQSAELITLAQADIASIELTVQPTRRRDRFGNFFRARAVVHLTNGRQMVVWDVFLAARLTTGGASAALPRISWPGPTAAGLAGLGAILIAFGLGGVARRRFRRHRPSGLCGGGGRGPWQPEERVVPVVLARLGATGVTTLAVVLLWPSASFGQGSQTWQVVEYYDTDAIGSVRVVTDKDGLEVARHDFLPFGEELVPQTTEKKLFAGQERDFETGQDYVGARQLRTDLGRFLAPDPMSSVPRVVGSQGLNAYAYVRNDPLGLVDPTGLDPGVMQNLPIQYTDGSPTDFYSQLEQHGDMWWSLYANGYNYTDTDIAAMEAAADAAAASAQQVVCGGTPKPAPKDPYSGVQAAGVAAEQFYNPDSKAIDREFAGNIYEDGQGQYFIQEPNICQKANSYPPNVSTLPAGTTLRAVSHARSCQV